MRSPSWKTGVILAGIGSGRVLAISVLFGHIKVISDKQLALDSIERLPEDVSLDAIAERMKFLAAIRKGLNQIERGQTMAHEEVKRQLAAWST